MHPLFENHPPRSEASPSSQIEDYLDHLCALLVHKRTYEQRLAIREEVRSHLLVLVGGHEELGSTPAEAIQAAIQQFGDAKQIGHSLLSEYRTPFVLNSPLLWKLMPVAVGGVLGSIAFVTMDLLVRQTGMTTYIAVNIDCLLGFAAGLIPAIRLLKRPPSSLQAALKTGGFYLAVTTGVCLFACVAAGESLARVHFNMVLAGIASMGVMGALGGAAMPPLFRFMQRFAPQSKPEIAR